MAAPEQDNSDYFLALKKQQALPVYTLLSQQLRYWTIPEQKALRATVLEGKESLPQQLKTILFSQPLNDAELQQALAHADFTLVYAALVNCYCQGDNSLSDKLFKVFSSSSEPSQKAQLLQLAGLVDDSRWHEPCALFCKAHPEFCQTVLSHFVYKSALVLVIELMGVAQTQQAAYQAWLTLTDRPLAKAEALTLVSAQNQHHVQAGVRYLQPGLLVLLLHVQAGRAVPRRRAVRDDRRGAGQLHATVPPGHAHPVPVHVARRRTPAGGDGLLQAGDRAADGAQAGRPTGHQRPANQRHARRR